ncbi:MAG UNVERIFIED_CONTAM: hypothetical protein LVQ98_08735 [Rickettsiaceae bacterium]|jgi:hypothetical protein
MATSIVDILWFEKAFPSKRASFHELETHGVLDRKNPDCAKIYKLIDDNPCLSAFYKQELLYFSTSERIETSKLLRSGPTLDECDQSKNLLGAISSSLIAFTSDYANPRESDLSRSFLTSCAVALSNTKGEENSFEGLSVEDIPSIKKSGPSSVTRSEGYDYHDQKIKICFKNFPAPLGKDNTATLLAAHEMTHAIDEVCDKTHSIRVLYDTLCRYAGPDDKTKQGNIIRAAAILVDDPTDRLNTSYLEHIPDFQISKYLKDPVHDRAFQVNEDEKVPTSTKGGAVAKAAKMAQDMDGALDCPSVAAEFLTFGTERLYECLADTKSNLPAEFRSRYTAMIQQKIERVASAFGKTVPCSQDFVQKTLGPALEMIQQTMDKHLEGIQRNPTNSQLIECCYHAQMVLREKVHEIGFKPEQGKSPFLGGDFIATMSGSASRESSPQDLTHIADSMRQGFEQAGTNSTHVATPVAAKQNLRQQPPNPTKPL